MAIATLERLAYWYPNGPLPAIRAERLNLDEGLTLVTGPSGGGKSTLLRLLNGLVPHFHGGRITGRAEVFGRDVIATPTHRLSCDVGFVFQDPERQFVHGTVWREIAFGLENMGIQPRKMDGLIEGALAVLGIGELHSRKVSTLSGGERQRVAIAATLAMGSRLLVLDEPTSQLDGNGTEAVVSSLAQLVRSGHHVVISEHRLTGLRQLTTAVCRVADGRPEVASPADLPAEEPPARRREIGAGGEVAWALSGVAAGPAGAVVIEGVNVEGRRGEVMMLRGPNGGGKSTFLRTLAGLLRPLSGSVDRLPGRVAYLPQDPAALLYLPSVRAEVALTLGRARDREAPEVVLAALGLTALAGRYPRDLSSGERQRVAIAATLAGSPAIALLDEPTRGMDRTSRIALRDLVFKLAEAGTSVVIASHDDLLCTELADRVVQVRDGRAS